MITTTNIASNDISRLLSHESWLMRVVMSPVRRSQLLTIWVNGHGGRKAAIACKQTVLIRRDRVYIWTRSWARSYDDLELCWELWVMSYVCYNNELCWFRICSFWSIILLQETKAKAKKKILTEKKSSMNVYFRIVCFKV